MTGSKKLIEVALVRHLMTVEDRGEMAEWAVEAGEGATGERGVPDEPVVVPIGDVFDLHSFRPAEVADVVREYLDAAYEKGLRRLRLIHGRGQGVQRRTVRSLLARDPRVEAFGDAPAEAGGWGATWVRLR